MIPRPNVAVLATLFLTVGWWGCSTGEEEPVPSEAPAVFRSLNNADLPPELFDLTPWKGDLEGIAERGFVRALVTFSRTNYFFDGAEQRGLTYELLKAFEDELNRHLERKHLRVRVLIIPVRRDELLPGLQQGMGDLACANLTITDPRVARVDFSEPFVSDVAELIVTGPASAGITRISDLAGKQVHVRRSSSYFESLTRLNGLFREAGEPEIQVITAPEYLETEDLLEMVNAGLIPVTVADSYLANFWSEIFQDLRVDPELAVRRGRSIGWAFRKNSPELCQVINDFVPRYQEGSFLGNVLQRRYFRRSGYVRNALSDQGRLRFRKTGHLFQKYADLYDLDWLLLAAMGYQESRLNQKARSHRGAIGILQIRPTTAADPSVGIPNIYQAENNIHAGAKYLRHIADTYFPDPSIDPLNRTLLTFAAYNAGPARIVRLRREAEARNLDPDVWFRNVEVVAAERIGRETVQYVSNIYKYYLAYRLAFSRQTEQGHATA